MKESIEWIKVEDKLPEEIGRRYVVYSPAVGVYSVKEKLQEEDLNRLSEYLKINNITHWAYINPPKEERLCFYIWLAIAKDGEWIPLGDITSSTGDKEKDKIKLRIYDCHDDNLKFRPENTELPCVAEFKFHLERNSKTGEDDLRCEMLKSNSVSFAYKQTEWKKEML